MSIEKMMDICLCMGCAAGIAFALGIDGFKRLGKILFPQVERLFFRFAFCLHISSFSKLEGDSSSLLCHLICITSIEKVNSIWNSLQDLFYIITSQSIVFCIDVMGYLPGVDNPYANLGLSFGKWSIVDLKHLSISSSLSSKALRMKPSMWTRNGIKDHISYTFNLTYLEHPFRL